jgi:predicted RND superfamily exporter protein
MTNLDHTTPSIEQLLESLNQLAIAQTKNEKRYASLIQIYRWAAIGFVAFASVVFWIGFNLVSKTYAANNTVQNEQTVVSALNNINENLSQMTQGMGVLQDMGKFFHSKGLAAAETLVLRLKQDSDVMRGRLNKEEGSGLEGLENLQKTLGMELNRLNATLAAIPPMVNEMHEMNRQMSIMSYGVGSTMGRMGSIIPW